MKISGSFTEALHRQAGSRRWVNFPFIIILGALMTLGFASDERLPTLWPYVVLFAVFVAQFVWPTILGWLFSVLAWLVIAFGYFLYERLAHGIGRFNIGFLCIWGIVPAIVLYLFRPRSADGDSGERHAIQR
jgi:hypothetical protein